MHIIFSTVRRYFSYIRSHASSGKMHVRMRRLRHSCWQSVRASEDGVTAADVVAFYAQFGPDSAVKFFCCMRRACMSTSSLCIMSPLQSQALVGRLVRSYVAYCAPQMYHA